MKNQTFINQLNNRITSVQNLINSINLTNKHTNSKNRMSEKTLNQLTNTLTLNVEDCGKYYPYENIIEVLNETLIGWKNK